MVAVWGSCIKPGFYFGNPQLTADGKRLVFYDGRQQSDVYLGELSSSCKELKSLQRLTLDDRVDWPGGWSADSKTVFLYSDRNGHFDIYKQAASERNATQLVTGSEEKWAPQLSPDGEWAVYLQGQRVVGRASAAAPKLMRAPLSGGPSETITDVTGTPTILMGGDPTSSVGGFPSFRCPLHGNTYILAEADETQIKFAAFDPAAGHKNELLTVPAEADFTAWDLSRDGSAISTFDHKAGDIKIITVANKTTTKLSAMPWTQLAAVAWAADGGTSSRSCHHPMGTIWHSALSLPTPMRGRLPIFRASKLRACGNRRSRFSHMAIGFTAGLSKR